MELRIDSNWDWVESWNCPASGVSDPWHISIVFMAPLCSCVSFSSLPERFYCPQNRHRNRVDISCGHLRGKSNSTSLTGQLWWTCMDHVPGNTRVRWKNATRARCATVAQLIPVVDGRDARCTVHAHDWSSHPPPGRWTCPMSTHFTGLIQCW